MIVLLVLALLPDGTDYFVRPDGDDRNPGTSRGNAWKTLERAGRADLEPGDRVLLAAGGTFPGRLVLDRNDSGDRDRPVVVTVDGEEAATIDAGAGSAVVLRGATDVEVRGLKVRGAGRLEGNRQGVGVLVEECERVLVRDVEAWGFQRAGAEVRGSDEVRVVGVYAHDNGYAGISSSGAVSRNLAVLRCRAINNPGDPTIRNNHSGNGIVLFRAEGALIEGCEAAKNGWDMPRKGNGPVGIWCADSDRVTIRGCISHHNRSPGADGGGFDFDGGTTNSVMEFNYSHDNQGWGYLLYEYGSERPFRSNVVRWCVSENDGDAGFGVGVAGGAPHGVRDVRIHQNVVVNHRGAPAVHVFEGRPREVVFRNNIFVTKDAPQIRGDALARFEGNVYWSVGGGFGVGEHDSLEAWSAATGQERREGVLVGVHADPGFRLPPGERLTDPARLGELKEYALPEDSPLRGKGLELRRLGVEPGDRDFFGNRLPRGAPEPGVHDLP